METTFWTIIAGTIVFTLGQLIQNFVLSPLLEFSKARKELHTTIGFHSNSIINGSKDQDLIKLIREKVRQQAFGLEASYYDIPLASLLARLKLFNLPSEEDVNQAFGHLIFLSNALGGKDDLSMNSGSYKKVYELLRIKRLKGGVIKS